MTQAAKILSLAEKEVGIQETYASGHWVNDSKYNRWFGKIPGYPQDGYGYPWCAVFVSWCAYMADLAGLYPRTASCVVGVSWFKERKRWSEYPAIGAQVFYGSGGKAHTGIVYKYDVTYVYTIEGNTNSSGSAEGDGVYEKKRTRRDSYVYGYGYPEFDEGIVTADPSKKGLKGFTYKTSADAPKVAEEPKSTEPEKSPEPKPASKSKPKVEYEPFPGAAYFKKAPKSSLITRMGKRLVAEGCSAYQVGPGAQWSEADRKSYRKWQLKMGFRGADADGWPGKVSWDRLKVPKA